MEQQQQPQKNSEQSRGGQKDLGTQQQSQKPAQQAEGGREQFEGETDKYRHQQG